MSKITGKDLQAWGFAPGKWFGPALKAANAAREQGSTNEDIRSMVREFFEPKQVETVGLKLPGATPVHFNIRPQGNDAENVQSVINTMWELVRVPTVKAGAVMPDACPAGTIPVGGVVATENAIHPGFHSADVCCSMAMADLGRVDPKDVLDRAMAITHFGVGGRKERDQHSASAETMARFEKNKFLQWHVEAARTAFATQGDGNHFLYVGTLKSTGNTVVVTHHGSRLPGARLYRAGMQAAEFHRSKHAPEVPKGAAWIPADSDDGRAYWDALQIIREWTRESHFKIHQLIGLPIHDWFWNEHNFVFQKSDGLFYHAKGATPGWMTSLVPLNMAEPILITTGKNGHKAGLGFLPHGAGRDMSRTQFMKSVDDPIQFLAEQTKGIDARFFSGKPDLSEMPAAYKNAAQVRAEIEHYQLADVIDEVLPYGNIMAGEQPQFWRKK